MKNNSIIKKILIIILMILTIFSLSSSKTYASESITTIFTEADDFVRQGQTGSTDNVMSKDTIQKMSNTIYNILLVIAIIIAVIWGIIIGIQYMIGSVGDKVKVKESLIPYVAGCIVVFGAFTIWKLVVTVLQSAPSA